MDGNLSRLTKASASSIAAAIFLSRDSVRDAITDLNVDGFGEQDIYVAFSREGKRARPALSDPLRSDTPEFSEGEHSLSWKIRQGVAHDMHRSTIHKVESANKPERQRQYTAVDLDEALGAMGVAENRIQLLNRELGVNGILVLVMAFARLNEVNALLARDHGLIRTDSATEGAHVAA